MSKLRRWPLVFIALPAAVAIWNGWVGLGGMTGFGPVHPLPGIRPGLVVNTAITLPVGLEAYAAYALAAWLGPWLVSARARRFAMWSALGSLMLGMTGQIAFHLLTAWHQRTAPGFVIVLVACVPVIVVGLASGLTHLLRDRPAGDAHDGSAPRASFWENPLGAAVVARVAPRPVPEIVPGTVIGSAAESDSERAPDVPPAVPEIVPEIAADVATEPVTEAPAIAPATRQEPRRKRAAKVPAWHATARKAVTRNPGITPSDLAAKCEVSRRSAYRYLQDHPPMIHAVQERTEAS